MNGNSEKAAEASSVCLPLYIFARTPLHVGAGASVGAIDLPIQRERHTGFPILPGSTLKGVFADCWNEILPESGISRSPDGKWLFGSEDSNSSAAGALQFSEAKLLAFPIRSAKGCFAWITSPLILKRYARDLGEPEKFGSLPDPGDEGALFDSKVLGFGEKVVLEEYTFTLAGEPPPAIGKALAALLPGDPIWREVEKRTVVLSDASVSFFARSACEVAQHVKIDDEKGTAATRALFNQENVPGETMFYALVRASRERRADAGAGRRTARDASNAFRAILEKEKGIFQFGADAGTGLGFCTVRLGEEAAS
ncbi:type III-B CRISPR module RAMP protein Cmr4 [Methylacidimicrobium cyclopophantes]|nr:type III-B CRISPR module RAMP protein Cmr4 [Methylacidimicrobium cyclopophantes]